MGIFSPTRTKNGKKPFKRSAESTVKNRINSANRFRLKSQQAREISEDFPQCTNKKLRDECLASLEKFAKTCFPDVFYLEFGESHKRVVAKIEHAVTSGGQFCVAMQRGGGKSALCAVALLWSIFKGLHQFALVIGATQEGADELTKGIKTQLETNQVLFDLFPETCYPIRRLEGVTQRRLLWHGELIRIKLKDNFLVLPNLPPGPAASACIGGVGLTGRVRGKKFTRPDGSEVRPSFVMLDDPQTTESADSPSQCDTRERLLNGDVLGLAGPGKKLSIVMPCTVIRKGDLADRMLDNSSRPEWQGERIPMLLSLPENETIWDEYKAERNKGLIEDGTVERGNRFYVANRDEMDRGALASWPARFRSDELSAVQSAMNIRLYRPLAFAAECQQEPIDQSSSDTLPSFRGICDKLNGLPRYILPSWANHLVVFIDVQSRVLPYAVMAFGDDFSGALVDYGTYPGQTRGYWTLGTLTRTLQDELQAAGKAGGEEDAIWYGLHRLTDGLINRSWIREDRAELRVGKCLVDSGYQAEIIYEFCRRSPNGAILLPSKGMGISAKGLPMSDFPIRPGEKRGLNTILTSDAAKRVVRLLKYDTNFWKTFSANRSATLSKGSLTVFGQSRDAHQLLEDHCSAETPIPTEGRGRKLFEWVGINGRDNHFLDCVVGCHVAASIQGVAMATQGTAAAPRKKVSFSAMQANRKSR